MKLLRTAAIAALVIGVGYAIAQTPLINRVANVGQSGLIQVIPGGSPSSASYYATVPQVVGVQGFKDLTSAVGGAGDPAYTFTAGITNAFAHGSGTISTVTLTTEANPGNGQRECWWADVATTTLTWTANTGQSIGSNVHGAGVAYTSNCITYESASASWFSSN